MNEAKKILFGLTTTPQSDWRDKIEEIKQLGLKEIALLPTMLLPAERQEFYKLLESSGLESVPYVHLRGDFTTTEIHYLIEKYKVKAFSMHTDQSSLALLDILGTLNTMVYLENPASLAKVKNFTKETFTRHQAYGICMDLTHYQAVKDNDKPGFKKLQEVITAYPIDITHISAYRPSFLNKIINKRSDSHLLKSLKDLDYLKMIPGNFFGKFIVIELENSFLEQAEVKKYLELILKDKLS